MLNTLPQPYGSDATDTIYNLLFCDTLELYRANHSGANDHPWKVILSDAPAEADLRDLVEDDSVESRLRLLAANRLRSMGGAVGEKRLLGVVAEVRLDEGLDTIAAYADGTARYINHTGKMVLWESPTPESNALISELLSAGWTIVQRIGPWKDDRLPAPTAGKARISFLVSDGLSFGEAPFEVLHKDPMGGAVLNSAAALMGFLIDRSLGQS